MGLESLAAGLVVTGKDKVSPVLAKIGQNFGKLQRQGAELKRGMGMIAGGMKSLMNIAGVGLGVAMAVGANKAAAFEEQMSVVQSVLQNSGPEFEALRLKIKQLGATTVFSATQAAEGAEYLSRAGFTATEQLDALSGTLNAAAAEAIPLGTAANIVANNVRAFGLDAVDATRVADVMANTAAKTNTNMIQLGEALKFAAPEAKALGISIEDTSFSLGLLANAGLQGTIGGTAFKNMLIKLGRPTEQVKKKLNELGITFQDTKGDMLPVATVIKNIAGGLKKVQGNLAKTGFLTDFLGLRGKAAAQNLIAAFEKMGPAAFDKLQGSINNSAGAAKRMAEIRLDNLRGSFVLLGSAIEGLSIELFTGSLSGAKTLVAGLANAISVVVIGLQQTDAILAGGTNPELDALREKLGPLTDSLLQISFGIKDGMNFLAEGAKRLEAWRQKFNLAFGESSDGMRGLAKFAVIAAPVIVALATFGLLAGIIITPLLMIGSGLLVAAKAAGIFAILGLGAFGIVAGGIDSTRAKGQSFADRFIEIFKSVEFFITDFAAGFSANFFEIQKGLRDVGLEFESWWAAISPIFAGFGIAMGDSGESGKTFGATVAAGIGFALKAFSHFMNFALFIPKLIISNFIAPFIGGLTSMGQGFMNLLTGTGTFKDNMIKIFKGLAVAMTNALLAPLKLTFDLLVKMGDTLGLNKKGIGMKGLTKIRDELQAKPGTLLGVSGVKKKSVMGDLNEGRRSVLDDLKDAVSAKDQAKIETGRAGAMVNVQMPDNFMPEINAKVDNSLCVDGKPLAVANAKVSVELSERTGHTQNPRQQGQISFNGGLPTGTR